MKESPSDICELLLKRSYESLDEARILAQTSHWNICVNRLYYSCFYAVSALLHKYGFSSSKHSGVRSLFNNHFVRTKFVSKVFAAIYNDLFDRRQESDYGIFFTFEKNDVSPWFNDTEKFITEISRFIHESPKHPL